MRNFIYGFIFGAIVFGVGVAIADSGVLFTINNQPVSTSNPVYVRGI